MQQIDNDVLLFLNGLHNQFFDTVFWHATNGAIYLPLYLIVIWLTCKQFGWRFFVLFGFIIATFLLTDQSCNILKDAVGRLRPTHNPDISSLVHIIKDYRGGEFGFPSAHACNTFGIAFFLYHVLRPKRLWVTITLFAWAVILSYSRIYLGVHYLSDILCGALLGVFAGWMMSTLFRFLIMKFSNPNKKKGERAFSLF